MSASQAGELLTAGHTCSHSACNTIDFLPFNCHHCNHSFCQEHWKPEQHSCNNYDSAANDRIVPQCPLCNTPVTIPSGSDVNDVMDRHILTNCSVALTKKQKGQHCANPKCGKALITPIICQDCKKQFCLTHRFPNAHTCRPSAATTASSSSAATLPLRPAGLAAFKRAAANTVSNANTVIASAKAKAAAKPSSNRTLPSSSGAGPSKPGLVQELKTDRRSKAEEKSRAKAMETKAKKGLLTPEEQKRWEEAQKNKDDDCIIM